VALSNNAARELSELSGLALKHIRVLHNPTGMQLAKTILEASESTIDADIDMVRQAEEDAVRAESDRLRQISREQAEKSWNEAMHGGPPLSRLFRALRSVRRYPEFFRRARQAATRRVAGFLPLF